MHSVQRSPEPDYFAEWRRANRRWEDVDSRRIRDSLAPDFGPVCCYCEQPCGSLAGDDDPEQGETVDHFRPRNLFPELSLDWLNLMYCCHRCNRIKGGKWPQPDDEPNRASAASSDEFVPVTEYVNPNAVPGTRPAGEFFDFNLETGEIFPSPHINNVEWHIARRTIDDIDLNDGKLAANDPAHLWNRRLRQRALLIERINGLDDFDSKVAMMFEFMLSDKPFSGFMTAYIRNRFPVLRLLFGP